jgi:hypothetical protein
MKKTLIKTIFIRTGFAWIISPLRGTHGLVTEGMGGGFPTGPTGPSAHTGGGRTACGLVENPPNLQSEAVGLFYLNKGIFLY